jgi:C-terminal processing protease CtpA/Prc
LDFQLALKTAFAQTKEDYQTTIKIPELINSIYNMYVEDVDKLTLERNIVKGMNNGISPYSEYQSESIVKSILPNHKDAYQSIGIKYKFKGDTIEVVDVLEGSGAQKAKLIKVIKFFKLKEMIFQKFII